MPSAFSYSSQYLPVGACGTAAPAEVRSSAATCLRASRTARRALVLVGSCSYSAIRAWRVWVQIAAMRCHCGSPMRTATALATPSIAASWASSSASSWVGAADDTPTHDMPPSVVSLQNALNGVSADAHAGRASALLLVSLPMPWVFALSVWTTR